jgi:hypothetical protein
VVLQSRKRHLFQMAASDDQQPVQAIGADRTDPAPRVGIRRGRLYGRQDDLGALGAEHLVEGAAARRYRR